MSKEIKYQVVLKTGGSFGGTVAVVAQDLTLEDAKKKVSGLNKYNSYTYGGFGKYYDFEKEES